VLAGDRVTPLSQWGKPATPVKATTEWNEAKSPFLERTDCCYESYVSDTSKKREFEFYMFTWDT